MTFDSVLVANRGEIAVRILRTAARLGLRTVAVFSDPDRPAPHVGMADTAVRIGPAAAKDSYLQADRVIEAALSSGAGAIHPGYGFLSEDAGFATAVEAAGLVFVGPTPAHLEMFGLKHTARDLARAAGVPMIDGSGLLADVEAARVAAERIGYPVMVKATGGGGGIGLQACRDEVSLVAAFERVDRLARNSFGYGGVFLERYVERARHVEVQVFGDGLGQVIALGDRDCSLQRRNQKVIEEAPAPGLPDEVRARLHESATALCASVGYRSAGTVEFVYDAEREVASFLEVNARLQVEHPVTEQRFGVDLVEWMLRLAQGENPVADWSSSLGSSGPSRSSSLDSVVALSSVGSAVLPIAVEARIYAEDPTHDHRPSAGLLTRVEFPPGVRVESWIETGTEIGTAYDPMLAKVIATGADREAALDGLALALAQTRVDGIETNLGLLRAALADPRFRAGEHSTATLATIADAEPRIEILRGGTTTTVQDWPGRRHLWEVGVPPSGAMDDRSLRLGNLALGNPEGAAGLECTLQGPVFLVSTDTRICVTGADVEVLVDGVAVATWTPVDVLAGSTVDVGTAGPRGLRTYVLFAGGLDVPEYLGSTATFTLGQFGGHGGRALRTGDVLRTVPVLDSVRGSLLGSGIGPDSDPSSGSIPGPIRPALTNDWMLAVQEGPHAAPDFFTGADLDDFYAAAFEVHFNSSRTGVRLIGPKPRWTREDGGEAGLHPSNIHDTPYSVGAVDYTGDVPILLGPDGPSLGGFVCPATVVIGERWKLGQLRPGDTVRFVPVTDATAETLRPLISPTPLNPAVIMHSGGGASAPTEFPGDRGFVHDHAGVGGGLGVGERDNGVLGRREATEAGPAVTYRRSGDDNLLIEYGEMTLDLGLRMRVHALAERFAAERLDGVLDVTPGIRSLQIHVDPDVLPPRKVLDFVQGCEDELPATGRLVVPSRTVRLPLSWDDPATREAIARYMAGVRADAPWCPWNIEFIRRVNGLDSVDDVYRTVFDAEYLVLGLGDVYLGAPVATPLDPRHRLVTTKYNPARTWTPENAVGIGGAYLCIYGMEGPGGYQFVGRTTQVWSRFRQSGPFEPGSPWLLRHFDRISWYPVSAEELLDLRADMAAGRMPLEIEDGTFGLAEHEAFLAANAGSIAQFRAGQSQAFGTERAAWAAAGEFDPRPEPAPSLDRAAVIEVPPGGSVIEAGLVANVWRVDVRPGDRVAAGQTLIVMEAMKMEMPVSASAPGTVLELLVRPGDEVRPGTPLLVVGP
jgi:urea carboxylase